MNKRDFKVIIDKEKRIVMVINTDVRFDMYAKMRKYNVNCSYSTICKYIPEKVTAVAHCNIHDKFVEEIGYKLAMTRYKKAMSTLTERLCNITHQQEVDRINNVIDSLNSVYDKKSKYTRNQYVSVFCSPCA